MKKLGLKYLLLCSVSFPMFAIANPVDQSKKLNFAVKDFNNENYQICSGLLHQCPTTGPIPDQSCVDKTIKENASCQQLHAMTIAIESDPTSVTVEPAGKFLLIDQLFVADGQHAYYLVLPEGNLVKMDVDPRDFSQGLKQKYKDTQFMVVNSDKPKSNVRADGSQYFTLTLKVTDTCLACKIIGYAKMKFDFEKNGKLGKISVVQFEKNL